MTKIEDIVALNTIVSLESANHQLLENQSFLHTENQRLQDTIADLNLELANLRSTSIPPKVLEEIQLQNRHLQLLNRALKAKVKDLKVPPQQWTEGDVERDRCEQRALAEASDNLGVLVHIIKKQSERLEIRSNLKSVSNTIEDLKEKVEIQEKRNAVNEELLRHHWENNELFVLQDKMSDLRRVNNDLQIENARLKFQYEEAQKEIDRLKSDLVDTKANLHEEVKKTRILENERDVLKQNVNMLENANLALKREMIEELNEANRAKRVCIDAEIALKQVKEAFEDKRQEVVTLTGQLAEALERIRVMSTEVDRESKVELVQGEGMSKEESDFGDNLVT